jgi:phosphocarrier protein
MTKPFAVAEAVMTHVGGLHARPSVKVTKLAKAFPCAIELATAKEGPWVDAKSIVKVMATRAPTGATVYLRARGERADVAVAELKRLIDRLDEDTRDAAEA